MKMLINEVYYYNFKEMKCLGFDLLRNVALLEDKYGIFWICTNPVTDSENRINGFGWLIDIGFKNREEAYGAFDAFRLGQPKNYIFLVDEFLDFAFEKGYYPYSRNMKYALKNTLETGIDFFKSADCFLNFVKNEFKKVGEEEVKEYLYIKAK